MSIYTDCSTKLRDQLRVKSTHLLLDVSEGVHGKGREVLLRIGQPQVQRVHGLIEELGHQLPLWLELGLVRAGRAVVQVRGEGETRPPPGLIPAHGDIRCALERVDIS